MAPDPQCKAIAAAQARTGLTYGKLASMIGTSEQHVIDIMTGSSKPTKDEFDKLARALNITAPLPHDSAHSV